jgi:hypothetical protein
MHRLTAECRAILNRTLSARRQRSMIALAIIESMIDVAIETLRPVIPRPRPNEYPA